MALHLCDLPEEHAEITARLNRQLVDLHLRELVAELAACQTGDATTGALPTALGTRLPEVLQNGLGSLDRQQVRGLLRDPQLLLDLQERILLEGGPFWQTVDPVDTATRQRIAEGRQRLRQFLQDGDRSSSQPTPPAVTRPAVESTTVAGRPWYTHPAWGSLATAAALLVALGFWDQMLRPGPPQVATGWGWNRPGALNEQASPTQYFENLANSADQWFNQRPTAPRALAQRISTFRQGCSTLILSEHRPLSPEDRQWLVTKCRAWSVRLDAHLTALESGQDVAQVRAAADETVRKLAAALRARAASV